MKIPSDNRWIQTNNSDVFGVLNDSRNITLDRPGKVTLSKKAVVVVTSVDDTDFERTMSIVYFPTDVSKYIAVTTDEAFYFDLIGGLPTEIASTPTTTLGTDAMVHEGRMYVTTDTNFSNLTATPTWNLAIAPAVLTGSVPHPMAIFDSQTTYKLAIGDDNRVQLYDNSATAPAKSSTDLILPSQYVITTLAYSNGYLFVGTKNKNGGNAVIFIWDGSTTNANYAVPVGADRVYSLTPYRSTVAGIASSGELFTVNGSLTSTLAGFPIFYEVDALWQDSTESLFQKVFHRGMVVVGETIYISITGSVDRGTDMKSGVWEYNPNYGLHHRVSLASDQYVIDTGITFSGEVLTTTASHSLKTGDAVQFYTKDTMTGFDTNFVYYVSVQSSNTLKVAISRKALSDGNFITFGGTAGNDALLYIPNTDQGMIGDGNGVAEGHAIGLVSNQASPLQLWASPIVFSGRTDNIDGTEIDSIYQLGKSFTVGSITTQRVYSPNIEDTWRRIVSFIDGLKISTEQLIVKYRTKTDTSKPSLIYKGTWSGTGSIVSTGTDAEQSEWGDIDEGDELTLVDGYGRGYSVHVTSITDNAGTFTIVTDETIGTDTKAVYFTVDNFTKLSTHTYERELPTHIEDTLNAKGAWVQIKVEMRGFETELAMFDLTNGVNTGTK